MSVLVLLLPSRLRPSTGVDTMPAPLTGSTPEWTYAYSRDGRTVDQEGSAVTSLLPKAERVVLVVADEDVAWLPARLPRAAASRLRDALGGALEDQLLEDPGTTHFAVSRAGLRDGETTWVAVLHKPWLEGHLQELQQAGVEADALVAFSEPDVTVSGHARTDADGRHWAVMAGPHGVATWPLDWMGWRSRLDEEVIWTAEPAAATALAELGIRAERLVGAGERAMAAAVAGSNLLQFDLAPRMRGSRAILAAWATFKTARYRAIHVGLVALLVIQIIGLNVSAWHSGREVQAIRAQAETQLQQAFPSIKVIVDPKVQMEREILNLRQAGGQPGPTDLETWMDLASTLWTGQPEPLVKLKWSEQGLAMEAAQWPEAVVAILQEHARQQGWLIRLEGNTLRVMPPTVGR